MSETPISDSTPHNVAELGMLCRRLERELNAANSINCQQQLLDEANLRLQDRIKRLEEAGDAMLNAWLMPEDSMEYCDWVALSADAKAMWRKAKEAKL